ncbi:hypothetical protein [Bacillus sp. ISL-37]|uniref:hypothetical protein n=1 Tax=Bacillus sp. ISL-37 TaxID=2819123 RepID=UPI001BE91869|nr:hypothetical protein [Bacillus sp. ISL-37]
MSISKLDIASYIDTFVQGKQLSLSETPNTIKKKEIELYIEEYAGEHGIDFDKKSESTKTIYTLSVEGRETIVEFFYRYSHYYTRHSITLK